jgi:hypothetical protein
MKITEARQRHESTTYSAAQENRQVKKKSAEKKRAASVRADVAMKRHGRIVVVGHIVKVSNVIAPLPCQKAKDRIGQKRNETKCCVPHPTNKYYCVIPWQKK